MAKLIHTPAGLGVAYCGKAITRNNWDTDEARVTCPKCRKAMGWPALKVEGA